MGKLSTKVGEIMNKIYEGGPFNAETEEQLSKTLKENFEDCYKQAASELDNPEEEVPSPEVIALYIEDLPEAEQEKALAIVNDWFDNLEN